MFTGIVEEQGKVKKIINKKNLMVLFVQTGKVYRGIGIGDSVAVDGVCLTVTQKTGRVLAFDIMLETIQKTTLKNLKPGISVNLERSLRADGRLGGHFVMGHVDGVGAVKDKVLMENYVEYQIAVDESLAKYLAPKGCIAIDGISLTIGWVKGNLFSIYLIPHTLDVTTLGEKKPGGEVNVETDILARYLLQDSSLLRS